MSAELVHLEEVLRGRRTPTQRAVLRALLRGRSTAASIASELGLTGNAVNIALHELAKRGVVERVGRGRYRARENLVALAILDRVERLERRSRENHAVGERPSPTPRSAPTSSDRPETGGEP